MTDLDGWSYEGEWRNGLQHGRGVEIEPETADQGKGHYDGSFVNDKREGRGKETIEDLVREGRVVYPGSTVSGIWAGGAMVGPGVWHSPRQELRYVGGFEEGMFDGEGQLYGKIPGRFASEFHSRPTKLRGRFEKNAFVEGTITFENRDTYTGTFAYKPGHLCCIGTGSYTEANGDVIGMSFGADGTFHGYWVE